MKKLLTSGLLSGALACSLFADAKDDAFLKFFGEIVNDKTTFKIIKSEPINGSSLKSYVVEINYNNETFTDMYFSDGVVFIEDRTGGSVITMKDKQSPKFAFMQEEKKKEQQKILPDLADYIKNDAKYTIKIGNDKNKPTMVVFSDPDCPYCVTKLDAIEEDLKANNVVYILTPLPMHGESAIEKTLNILEETKLAKTDKEKITILKKYYNPNLKEWKNFKAAEVQEVFSDVNKIMNRFKVGGTPTIIQNVPVKY